MHLNENINLQPHRSLKMALLTGAEFQIQGTDLGGLFNDCLDNFAFFLHSASKQSAESSSWPATLRSTAMERAFEEYARLRIWGQDFRAGLPDLARSSLGETLRYDKELREQVESMFSMMNDQIELGISPTQRSSRCFAVTNNIISHSQHSYGPEQRCVR